MIGMYMLPPWKAMQKNDRKTCMSSMGCRLSKTVQSSGLHVNKIPLELALTQSVRLTSPRPRDSTLKISGLLK